MRNFGEWEIVDDCAEVKIKREILDEIIDRTL